MPGRQFDRCIHVAPAARDPEEDGAVATDADSGLPVVTRPEGQHVLVMPYTPVEPRVGDLLDASVPAAPYGDGISGARVECQTRVLVTRGICRAGQESLPPAADISHGEPDGRAVGHVIATGDDLFTLLPDLEDGPRRSHQGLPSERGRRDQQSAERPTGHHGHLADPAPHASAPNRDS
jgi:hypothetical protein